MMDRIGPYEIQERIGEGGMGSVYRALDPVLNRTVALKIVKIEGSESEELRDRLLREARTASSLSHAAIVPIYHAGTYPGGVYIAMEFVRGHSLDGATANGPLPKNAALSILGPIGSALDHAHARGIVHRDVKPANILIDEMGSARLCDFGIARFVSGADRITRTNCLVGTLYYMSPEQVEGNLGDGRSDQYSLAVVAYEVLAGARPFDGPTATAVIARILAGSPQPIHELNPNLPVAVSAVIERALSTDPSQRYKSCMELVDAISLAFQEGPREEPVVGEHGRKSDEATGRRSARWLLTSLLAVAFLTGGFAFLWFGRGRDSAQLPPPSSANRLSRRAAKPADNPETPAAPPPAPTSMVRRPVAPPVDNHAAQSRPAVKLQAFPTPAAPSETVHLQSAWPVYRGNLRRDGRSGFVGPHTARIAWMITLDGSLSGAVTGTAGRVYVVGNGTVYAVADGAILWSAATGSGGAPTPAITSEGSICVPLDDGTSRCFDDSGRPAAPQQIISPLSARSGEGEIYRTDGAILRSTGWQYSASSPFSTTPVVTPQGDVCAGTESGDLVCVDRLGQKVWDYRAPVRITASPAASSSGQVIFGCADRGLYCVRRGELEWRFATGGAIYSAPVLDRDGVLYFGSDDGYFYAVDKAGSLVWRQELGGEIRSSPALARDGSLYVTTMARRLYCIR